MVSDANREREAALTVPGRVNLVAYEWNGIDDWRSVIVSGGLSPTPNGHHELGDQTKYHPQFPCLLSRCAPATLPGDKLLVGSVEVEWRTQHQYTPEPLATYGVRDHGICQCHAVSLTRRTVWGTYWCR